MNAVLVQAGAAGATLFYGKGLHPGARGGTGKSVVKQEACRLI
jgi:hypothetical protein